MNEPAEHETTVSSKTYPVALTFEESFGRVIELIIDLSLGAASHKVGRISMNLAKSILAAAADLMRGRIRTIIVAGSINISSHPRMTDTWLPVSKIIGDTF